MNKFTSTLARRRGLRAVCLLPLLLLPLGGASLPSGKPEDVGMSTERLQRIRETVMRLVQEQNISGAVTLVARRGRLVHFEANGLMDIEAKKPMTRCSAWHRHPSPSLPPRS